MEVDTRSPFAKSRPVLILIAMLLLGLALLLTGLRQRSYPAMVNRVGEVSYKSSFGRGRHRHKAQYTCPLDVTYTDEDGQEQQAHFKLRVSGKPDIPKPGDTILITKGLFGVTRYPDSLRETIGGAIMAIAIMGLIPILYLKFSH